MESTNYKTYVSVDVHVDTDGKITPLAIIWEDGRRFEIDQVSDIRYAASRKAGGIGTRYTCTICGTSRYLYFEDPQWFVENNRS